jgi:hypothetical protein
MKGLGSTAWTHLPQFAGLGRYSAKCQALSRS